MEIEIKTIPHRSQRYETVGDYWNDEAGEHIRISEMGNKDYEFLVAFHELGEKYLCERLGIKMEDIDAFDIKFEEERKNGLHSEEDEPGDDIRAPYRKEHFFMTSLERLMAEQLGVDWSEYEKTVIKLVYG